MSTIDMPVMNFSASLDSQFTAPTSIAFAPKSSTGVGINLTGATFSGDYSPSGQTANGLFSMSVGTVLVSASAGSVVLSLSFANATPGGTYPCNIYVLPTGGTIQLFASGSLRSV